MPRVKSRLNSSQDDAPNVRTGGRVKKAKIVFDPSLNNMPRRRGRAISLGQPISDSKSGDSPPKTRQNKSPIASVNNQKKYDIPQTRTRRKSIYWEQQWEPEITDCCMVCEKVESKKERKLIPCKDCTYKVHASCLKINFQNQNLLEEHWRCNNCTTCVVCYETSEAGTLVTCCLCVDSYHLSCHTPKLSKALNKLKWECSKCQNISKNVIIVKIPMDVTSDNSNNVDVVKIERYPNNNNDNARDTSSSADEIDKDKNSITSKEVELTKANETPEEEIPDISDWSCDKVVKYVERYFPQEAGALREHEIDGASLLLMKRSDVIQGLRLKLGPAIRLYSFIVRLQSKSTEPRLTWM